MTNSRCQDALIDQLGFHLSEATIYGKLVKYRRLDEILRENPIIYNPQEFNIFIDMTQMLLPLYKFDNIENPMGVLASMLNIPLHYRHFFNKLKIKSNIFLIYSSNDSVNNYRYIPSYNSKHKLLIESNKGVKEVIDKNITLMQTVIPYFPGIYLKIGTVEPTVIAYDLIDKFTRGGHLQSVNLFISSSDYSYQLPAVLKNVLLIYKKSVMGEDNKTEDISFGVTTKNALSTYITMKHKQANLESINEAWIGPFLILNGLSCRDVKSLFSYTQAIKILKEISESYKLITPDSIYENIQTKNKVISKEEIYARYCALDIDYQLGLYRQLAESIESNFLKDIYDAQALYNINNTYFKESNAIDIIKL